MGRIEEPRQTTINLRASSAQKALIDQAVDTLGQSRSGFMLEASLERAEAVLADRTHFRLNRQQMSRFNEALDKPLPDTAALQKLLTRKAPWAD